jgi:hypothetical protein
MAFGNSLIAGDQQTRWTNDKPVIAACADDYDQTYSMWNQTGNADDPTNDDETDSDSPISALNDGWLSIPTKPDAAQTTWYLVVTFENLIDIDFLYLFNESIDGAETITVEVAGTGDDTFASAVAITNITEADFSGTDDRLFFPNLQVSGDTGDERRLFTDVKYLRIKYHNTSGTSQPIANELLVGTQHQLQACPVYPFNTEQNIGDYQEWKSTRGGKQRVTLFDNLKLLAGNIHILSSTDYNNFRDQVVKRCKNGAKPFIWCETPYSDQHTAWLMFGNLKELNPNHEPGRYIINIQAEEQGDEALGI